MRKFRLISLTIFSLVLNLSAKPIAARLQQASCSMTGAVNNSTCGTQISTSYTGLGQTSYSYLDGHNAYAEAYSYCGSGILTSVTVVADWSIFGPYSGITVWVQNPNTQQWEDVYYIGSVGGEDDPHSVEFGAGFPNCSIYGWTQQD